MCGGGSGGGGSYKRSGKPASRQVRRHLPEAKLPNRTGWIRNPQRFVAHWPILRGGMTLGERLTWPLRVLDHPESCRWRRFVLWTLGV